MRWAPVSHEKPAKDGQYYTFHKRYGKCVSGFFQGSWGPSPPEYFLENDQMPQQAPDGSFGK